MTPGPPARVRLRPDDVLLALALGALLEVPWHWPGGLTGPQPLPSVVLVGPRPGMPERQPHEERFVC
jgi:hypothetical protein